MTDEHTSTSAAPTIPGTRLSREVILDAYIRLADGEGPDAATLRRLGAELGVDPTAVYRHFPDKDAIVRAAADRLLGDLADAHVRSDDWRDDLFRLCLEGRAMYLAHPRFARLVAASSEPLPNNVRLAEIVIEDLRAAGLSLPDAALAYEAIVSYAVGGSSVDADVGSDANSTWRRRLATLDPARFPNVVAVAPYLFVDDEKVFAWGLDRLLDAIERRVRDT